MPPAKRGTPTSGLISLRGARQHNLKNLDIDFPRGSLTVVTGLSGSGKSSLAFDTLYAEGQRRYVESVSSYAKQFLERMQRPDFDWVSGLSPAVAIQQSNQVKSARSTVGTATEIYDYLRLFFARVGETFCEECGTRVTADTPSSITEEAQQGWQEGAEILVLAPLRIPPRLPWKTVAEGLIANGFLRVSVNGRLLELDPIPKLPKKRESLAVVVDRFRWSSSNAGRLAEACQSAFARGEGSLILSRDGTMERRSERWLCSLDNREYPRPEPILFSFNSPYGVCTRCRGYGDVLEFDLALIIPDDRKTLAGGAIDPWAGSWKGHYARKFRDLSESHGVRLDVPWKRLSAKHRRLVLDGTKGFRGVFPFLERLQQKSYKAGNRFLIKRYQSPRLCEDCRGSRLRRDAERVRVGDQNIVGASRLPLTELLDWVENITNELDGERRSAAEPIIQELLSRLRYLDRVDLGYLTLNRLSRTLSGGEMQRIELANALGANLVDTLYVLDEPTVGLHARDTDRLIEVLEDLSRRGNTLIIVEHDPQLIKRARWIVDLGPGAGEQGGHLLYSGPPAGLGDTATARYLSGEQRVERKRVTPASPRWLELVGARQHNLKNLTLRIPVGRLTCLTGVSGSGKSTLIEETLYPAVARTVGVANPPPAGEYETIRGVEVFGRVVLVDQSPIGRSPRSNPVTYLKAFDAIRELFASQQLSLQRGYRSGTFSFNVEGGRCEACRGEGAVKVEMYFLADLFVPCEECGGTRYRREILEVRVRGLNIREVLDLTVDQAIELFDRHPQVVGKLRTLARVGLGYLRLGQPAPTLSGGESQRLKVARELAEGNSAQTLYLLDEPTVGLHSQDVQVLLNVLSELVNGGATVVLIEHHLEVIRNADWVVDLGPGGGLHGGEIVAEGTPEFIAAQENSVTGRYLSKMPAADRELEAVGAASIAAERAVSTLPQRKRSARKG